MTGTRSTPNQGENASGHANLDGERTTCPVCPGVSQEAGHTQAIACPPLKNRGRDTASYSAGRIGTRPIDIRTRLTWAAALESVGLHDRAAEHRRVVAEELRAREVHDGR